MSDDCWGLRRYYDEVAAWNEREAARVEAIMEPIQEAIMRMAVQVYSMPSKPDTVWMSWAEAQRWRFPRRRTRKNPSRTTWGHQRA